MRTFLKWAGIILAVLVAIGLIVNAWFVWTTETRLDRQLAAIRNAGDPLTLADLARKPISPETNADVYLRQAAPAVEAMYLVLYRQSTNSTRKKVAAKAQGGSPKSSEKSKTRLDGLTGAARLSGDNTEEVVCFKATNDPYSGEPLRVRRLPQGWVVYAVGPNLRDDGGKVEDPHNGDVGVGPPLPAAKPGKSARK